jgi:DNA invertase Pin-like site-specific DNA recombinase
MLVGYVRISTDKQTIKNQHFEILNFVDKKNGWWTNGSKKQ